MSPDQMETLEQTSFSMVVQALSDYASQAVSIFREEVDQPQDIAEDVTREAIELMGYRKYICDFTGKLILRQPCMSLCQKLFL